MPPPTLLDRIAAGDALASQECVGRYARLVWTLALRHCASSADAEDAVQDIFVDLWKSAGRFDPTRSSEAGFVAMIAKRRLIDLQRSKRRRERAPVDPEPAGPSSPEVFAETVRVQRALSELRPEQREVLLLSACDGLTHDEIAKQTGLPLGTVKTHARRGLLRVRELLRGPQEGEP